MTNPPSTSHSTSVLQPSLFTRLSVMHRVSTSLIQTILKNKHVSFSASFCSRQGSGALCDGSEQVGHSGLGVPDDETQLDSGWCYWACATAPLYPAQPWLPETAESPWHHITRGEAETKKNRFKTNRRWYRENMNIYYLKISSKWISGIKNVFV